MTHQFQSYQVQNHHSSSSQSIPSHPNPSVPLDLLLPLLLSELRSLRGNLPHIRYPRHDIHLDGLLPTREMDLLSEFEAETTVQLKIERVAGFEVGEAVFNVALGIRISFDMIAILLGLMEDLRKSKLTS